MVVLFAGLLGVLVSRAGASAAAAVPADRDVRPTFGSSNQWKQLRCYVLSVTLMALCIGSRAREAAARGMAGATMPQQYCLVSGLHDMLVCCQVSDDADGLKTVE